MAKIESIEGIGEANAAKLAAAGVRSVEALLKQGCTKKGRKALAAASGVDEKRILTWVNMADLFRVKGIGSEYSELLEAAGVDSVAELKRRNAANLAKAMADINAEKKLVRAVPTEKRVSSWVEHAKTLEKIVTH
jgi:predicted flap endonuclease-1-like 5' DNA nuclease